MCEIIDKYINDGMKKGRAEGVKKGALALLLLSEGKSDQDVMRETQLSKKELAAIKEMVFATA